MIECDVENRRLQALYQYEILDTPREEVFDEVTRLLAYVCRTPVSLISFVDAERQWFKSEFGLGVQETERNVSFCSFAISKNVDIYIVPDTLNDPLFASNRLVLEPPRMRFYAGAPIVTSDGFSLGTVNVIDFVPRQLSAEQKDLLRFMARQVMSILELRYALRRAQRAEEFGRRLIESSRDCIIVLNSNGVVQSTYRGARHFFGIDEVDRYHGHSWPDLWEPHVRPQAVEAVESAKGGATGRFQAFRPTEGGEPRWWDVVVTPILEDAEAILLLSVARDITRSKELEQQLNSAKQSAEGANLAKDNFIAALSHELRTPLTPVLAAVSLMEKQGQIQAESIRHCLEIIRRNVCLEARLIDDLLDLTRIVRGKISLQLQEVDPFEVFQRVIETCTPAIEAKQIEVQLRAAGEATRVHGDSSRLQQVFWNLINNAVKFTSVGGRIGITVSSCGEQVEIEVTDSGMGIEPADLSRIFDAFEQLDQNITHHFGGLGLGLAISRRLVELHGGTITAESMGRGCGSSFRVRLPAARPAAQKTFADHSDGAHYHPCPLRRVLLVEDHPDTLQMIRELLEMSGCRVHTAANADEALRAASEDGFDVLISDLGLPGKTGFELMQELRRQGKQIGAIALSGFGRDEDIVKSRDAGFQEHLTKPVDVEQLITVIERLTASHA